MAESPRRFPPPWRADKMPGGYVVRDANGQALAHLPLPALAPWHALEHGESAVKAAAPPVPVR
jgi:hypothetical protein